MKIIREIRRKGFVFRNYNKSHTCNIFTKYDTEKEVDMFSFGDFSKNETSKKEFELAVDKYLKYLKNE